MTKLRIALVSEHASPLAALGGVDAGGQNVHVAALARVLVRLGCEVVVHTRRDDPRLPDEVVTADGYRVEHVAAGPSRSIPKDDIAAHVPEMRRRLAARWRAERPDLVHAHFWMSGLASAPVAQRLQVPFVQTFHALGVVKRRHQGEADTSPPERNSVERLLAIESDAVITTCTDEAREVANLGAPPGRIHVVPSGIDTTVFHTNGPVALRRPAGGRVVAVSRLVPRKGIADVITALAGIGDTELIVVGGAPCGPALDGDDEVRRLRALAERVGVADRVRFTGGLPPTAVAALLRSADLAACAPWYEPFGIVPVEAMACGTPVVGTAVGGLLDTVEDGVTGLLVAPRRPDALAGAMRSLLADPERRGVMSRSAAERARRIYDWRRVGRATLDVYRVVVGEHADLPTAVTA